MFIIFSNEGKFLRSYHSSELKEFPPELINDKEIIYTATPEEAEAIAASGSVELVSGVLVICPKLTIAIDKSEILADGLDQASITVKLPAGATDEILTIIIDDIENEITTQNGQAVFQFSTDTVGEEIITVRSSTKYGIASVFVRGL